MGRFEQEVCLFVPRQICKSQSAGLGLADIRGSRLLAAAFDQVTPADKARVVETVGLSDIIQS